MFQTVYDKILIMYSGCCLVIKKVKVDTDATLSPRGSDPPNKNRADARKTRIDEERDRSVDLIKSLVVMYEKSTTDNRLEFISAGVSTQARTGTANCVHYISALISDSI